MSATKRDAPKRKRKEQSPVTPAQALELLQSALRYCQQSGLQVECKSDEALAGLVIYLPTAKAEPTPAGLRFALSDSRRVAEG